MGKSKDEFKWFGDGFVGFPKTLPEDCIEYTVYLVDSNLDELRVRDRLRDVQASANQMTRRLLRDFIWQRDGFVLELSLGKGMPDIDCGLLVYWPLIELHYY